MACIRRCPGFSASCSELHYGVDRGERARRHSLKQWGNCEFLRPPVCKGEIRAEGALAAKRQSAHGFALGRASRDSGDVLFLQCRACGNSTPTPAAIPVLEASSQGQDARLYRCGHRRPAARTRRGMGHVHSISRPPRPADPDLGWPSGCNAKASRSIASAPARCCAAQPESRDDAQKSTVRSLAVSLRLPRRKINARAPRPECVAYYQESFALAQSIGD